MNSNEHHEVDAVGIELWLKKHFAELMKVPPDQIDPSADLESFGFDSAQSVSISVELEEWLGMDEELPPELFFEERTINSLAKRVEGELKQGSLNDTGTL